MFPATHRKAKEKTITMNNFSVFNMCQFLVRIQQLVAGLRQQ